MASGGRRRRQRMWEVPQAEEAEVNVEESERVPPSLQPLVPILRAASEIEQENPRVAYLCRFTAYEKAHIMDPNSSGRGVRQFKTHLLHTLEKDEQETQRSLASTDAREVQMFYEHYCRKNLEEGLQTRKQDEMARYYQIASVLYDVLKTVMPEKSHPDQFDRDKAYYSPYNILPLNISGPTQPVMEIPEIKAAVDLLRRIENLPKPRPDPNSMSEEINSPFVPDLLDWLWHTFGFQKGNVENQKEHLILLLANIDMRKGGNSHQGERHSHMIHNTTVMYLKEKIFENYISWCQYLHLEPYINKIPNNASTLQPELLYIGLYLLIWGEASNVRFMPECLCYIFHHMAKDLYDIISDGREDYFDPPFRREGSDDAFLQLVIQPIYNVMQKEAERSKRGTVSHSKWRNYDDLNEYFWSKKCFKQLGWPMDLTVDFFADLTKTKNKFEDHAISRQRMSKTNFVEVRTFLHLFRSFYRMWAFFILAFQVMVIIAWSPTGSLSAILEPNIFRNVLTIFLTAAFLNFFEAMLEIMLDWKAWRSLEWSLKIRQILKFFIATVWLVVLPMTYFVSLQNPTSIVKFFSKSIQSQSFYSFTIVLYIIPSILGASVFIFSPIQRAIERSNSRIIRFFIWWTQPKLYVAQGMREDTHSLLKYASFWILLLMWKLAFSFYVEIAPLVGPTRKIMCLGTGANARVNPNLGVVIVIWAPIIMVYLMDTQIWYAIFSTICGGVTGALCHLGEIRNLGMVRSRFEEIPGAFSKNLVPRYELQRHHYDKQSKRNEEANEIGHIDKFSDTWNLFIKSLREEDLISNRERSLLIVPSSSGDISVFQWPVFVLASKIPDVLDMVRRVKRKDEELTTWLRKDPFTYYAVIECYETVLNILYRLTDERSERQAIHKIREKINYSIDHQTLAKDFRLAELPQLRAKFGRLLNLLVYLQKDDQQDNDLAERQIVNLLQDIMEIFTQNIMCDRNVILKDMETDALLFTKINLDALKEKTWMDKCVRLQLLLTTEDSAIHVPTNLEARRRIIFFANSLFMKMPRAPQVQHMMSFSLLTTYYQEDVLFKPVDLYKMNDGMSMLYYLRTICPDEWRNFLERIGFKPRNEDALKQRMNEICEWASYRGQTLTRTVRGMMYYRKAIEIQCMQDKLGLAKLEHDKTVAAYQEYNASLSRAHAIADIKFTFVVACQVYGMQKMSKNDRDRHCYLKILDIMITYPSLRVAYIDEIEGPTESGTTEKTYYSVLVKGGGKYDEEIYRIKLPGEPLSIGEGKSENQNHAIIFTRGEGLQAIDMNQDNYLEEAFKMRNVLEEFGSTKHGKCKSTILGLREHIFTGSVSSLSWFASNQETSFVTIGQRVLANLLKVRFHYGHSDVFDRLFHITRGGISKASRIINLSGDTLSGFNSIMRGGGVTHHEYVQVGKGRDAGMNQLSNLEARVANGNGEQTLSRDICRLGHRFDFYRMLSFYFTTVGFYFSTMVTVITLYIFLYGRLYLVMSGLEKSILQQIKPLENVLALQSIFQLGFLLVLPVVMEVGLEKGFRTALGEFIFMQLQLAPLFFTFQLGTKSHYYGRTIMHGGSKYRPSGRDFFVHRVKFADNYRMYSRSHFVNGLELLMLLVMYIAYGSSHDSSSAYLFVTFSVWFLVASWLFAPFIFNPSGFEWQKTVHDWIDWQKWMGTQSGIDTTVDESWDAWWMSEQAHLRRTGIPALLFEIILSLRFLMYQYVIVFHLDIANHHENFMVYALSWVVLLTVLVILKMVSIGRQRFKMDLQLMFRILKVLFFFDIVSVTGILFGVYGFTVPDLFASILGFIPSSWCVLLIGQACSPLLEKTTVWDSIVELGWAYDNVMGFILFVPIAVLSWFPYVAECHTRLLFNQAFTRGLKISSVLDGQKDTEDF